MTTSYVVKLGRFFCLRSIKKRQLVIYQAQVGLVCVSSAFFAQ